MQTAPLPMNGTPPQAAPQAGTVPKSSLLQLFVQAIAVLHTLSAPFHLLMLLGSLLDDTAPRLGWVAITVIAVTPVVAIWTLVIASKNRLRHAIMGVGTLGLLDWLNYMPSFTKTGLEIGMSVASVFSIFYLFVVPVMCIAGVALAARNSGLWTAAILAATPMILMVLGITVMAASVAFYGF